MLGGEFSHCCLNRISNANRNEQCAGESTKLDTLLSPLRLDSNFPFVVTLLPI